MSKSTYLIALALGWFAIFAWAHFFIAVPRAKELKAARERINKKKKILNECGISDDFEWTEEYRIQIPDVAPGPSQAIDDLMKEDEDELEKRVEKDR